MLLTPGISCMLEKSILTTSGMQKHISNWQILPVVFWFQIWLMPRAINSFLAAKDRRAFNTLQKPPSTWQKSSFPCASTPWGDALKHLWQKWFSSLMCLLDRCSQLSLKCWIPFLPGKSSLLMLTPLQKTSSNSLIEGEKQLSKASVFQWLRSGLGIQFLLLIRLQRCLKARIEHWQKKLCAITRKFFSCNQDYSNEFRLHCDLWLSPKEYGFRVLAELSITPKCLMGEQILYKQGLPNTCICLT